MGNDRYQMFTEAGDDACEAEVLRIIKEAEQGLVTRRTLRTRYNEACKRIAVNHSEVYDTEPHGQIAHEISERVCKPQMWTAFTRWGDDEDCE